MARQPRRATTPVDDVDCQSGLQIDVRLAANPAQEAERLAIRADQYVLAVVDALAGCGIGEHRRSSTERRARLEDEHADTLFRQ